MKRTDVCNWRWVTFVIRPALSLEKHILSIWFSGIKISHIQQPTWGFQVFLKAKRNIQYLTVLGNCASNALTRILVYCRKTSKLMAVWSFFTSELSLIKSKRIRGNSGVMHIINDVKIWHYKVLHKIITHVKKSEDSSLALEVISSGQVEILLHCFWYLWWCRRIITRKKTRQYLFSVFFCEL